MKTTIELPDSLLHELKECAAGEGTTMRSVIEEALRRELDRRRAVQPWQPASDYSFGAGGLTDEAMGMSWGEIRELSSRIPHLVSQLATP